MISLFIAVIGIVLLAVGPTRYTGLIFTLTLAATLLFTVFDMSTHERTETDLAGFAVAFMLGGATLLFRSERGMKD